MAYGQDKTLVNFSIGVFVDFRVEFSFSLYFTTRPEAIANLAVCGAACAAHCLQIVIDLFLFLLRVVTSDTPAHFYCLPPHLPQTKPEAMTYLCFNCVTESGIGTHNFIQ